MLVKVAIRSPDSDQVRTFIFYLDITQCNKYVDY